MISDFYYLQYVESIDGYGRKDNKAKRLLTHFIVSQLRNRTKPDSLEDRIWFGLPFSSQQLEELNTFGEAYAASLEPKSWSEILSDIMEFAAGLSGRTMWGYNTPQDYLNDQQITQAFPASKFLFLLRSPDRMLLSYKYYWTTEPKFRKDRGRYHPLVQSLAWKTCVKSFLELKEKYGESRCFLVKFEEVVGETKNVTDRLERLTDVSFYGDVDISTFGHNSSLKKDKKRVKRLTSLEKSICRWVTQSQQQAIGYDVNLDSKVSAKDLLQDVVDLVGTTARNSQFYLSRFVLSKDTRKRVIRFARKATSP